jgi:hypothetical protein
MAVLIMVWCAVSAGAALTLGRIGRINKQMHLND